MSDVPSTSAVERVVKRPAVATKIREFLRSLPPNHPVGGITIGSKSASRALVYWGSCPNGTDVALREIASPFGYQISIVRDPSQFEKYSTL